MKYHQSNSGFLSKTLDLNNRIQNSNEGKQYEPRKNKIALDIGGMSCIRFAHTIEKEFAKLKGVPRLQ